MLKEFKKFALRGNMIDLAVGIIIGGAFNSIVNSLVNNLFMPVLSIITSGINFKDLFIALNGKRYSSLLLAQEDKAPTLNYGLFISDFINFLIMAFVVFLIVKWINKLRKPTENEKATTKKCPRCLQEIDLKATKCQFCTADINHAD
jgi:large conductance mechanosensitive channel